MISYRAIVTKPAAWSFNDYGEAHPTMHVIEDDASPQAMGLIDANGTPIYRVNNRQPVGFARN